MQVVIGSAFRGSVYYLPRYFGQVIRLREILKRQGHTLRLIAAEGDSVDRTRESLVRYADSHQLPIELLDTSHHGPWFGSTEAPSRLAALSKVGNAIFDAVKSSDDVLVYVESDLVWEPGVIVILIEQAIRRDHEYDVFSPLVFAGQYFYDIWAFRKNGERFTPFPPYHPSLNGGLTAVDSVGSCLVMQAEVARTCRIRDDYCLVGWCEDARSKGYRIAVCSDLKIHHP
jgi:hypothetical protein